jgi:hypothetical protein
MSTKCRAWLLGALVGGSAVAVVNRKFIEEYQRDMLLSLRRALVPPAHLASLLEEERNSANVTFPLFSRETLNLALISISDRFIKSRNE